MKQRTDPLTWMTVEDGLVKLSVDEFPDGSFRFTVDVDKLDVEYPIHVTLLTTLPEAMIGLFQVVGALQDHFNSLAEIHLIIQTFPDQRADRIEKPGQSVPAVISAAFIGVMNVQEIIVYDPHSPVFVDTLKTVTQASVHVVPANQCFEDTLWDSNLEESRIDYIVAVDKGSVGRAETTAEQYDAGVVYADKKRVEGKVVGHELIGPFQDVGPHDNIWVVDDLCDGGATFISIAKLLRETYKFGELNLYVTHGLFSKGKDELAKHFDTIVARFDYAAD